MATGELVTKENDDSVEAFVASVAGETRRRDAYALLELMERVTGEPPRMWGGSIIGFGRYHYAYASGREGDIAAAGFSPRTAAISVYFPDGFDEHHDLLGRLGPHAVGKGCLYIKRLDGIDLGALEELVRRSYTLLTNGEPFSKRLSGQHSERRSLGRPSSADQTG